MLTTLDFEPGETPEKIAAVVRECWPSSKVVHIRGPRPEGDMREYYWRFFKEVGEPLPVAEDVKAGSRDSQRTGGYWFEVRYDPAEPDAYRHSANAQPLHTDMSYIPIPNSVGFLGCVAMADTGGATTFIDSSDLVDALRAEAPDLLARLERTILPHARSGDRRVETVIRYDAGKPLLNWNYYCVDPQVDPESARLREEFFDFLKTSPGVAAHIRRVKLSPGDAVLWKDEHVLHGRDSFDADRPSVRFLWKSALLVDA
ncbi:MAG: gamma-butyrobetaine dioxygenase [Sphingomonadales bacterium]|nr:gamma-butyrobetaine dioxygenase [Sphingomonadales bacterium]